MKIGALMRLRSGGPILTVVRVDGSETECTWFQVEEFKKATFPAAALAPYPDRVPDEPDAAT